MECCCGESPGVCCEPVVGEAVNAKAVAGTNGPLVSPRKRLNLHEKKKSQSGKYMYKVNLTPCLHRMRRASRLTRTSRLSCGTAHVVSCVDTLLGTGYNPSPAPDTSLSFNRDAFFFIYSNGRQKHR